MYFRRSRRLLLLAAALLACHGVARADEMKTLHVGMIPTIDFAPFYAALTNGYFTEEGLKIDLTPTTGGAVGIPAVVSGALDIAAGNVVSTILAASRGLDIIAIAPASKVRASDPDLAAIVALTASTLHSGADLNGKTLAVNTRANVLWLYGRAWVRKTGGDPDKVTIKEVPFPQMLDALKGHQVDAAFMVSPFLNAALADPAFQRIGEPYQQVQPDVDVGQYEATNAFVREHPKETAAFLRALRKGAVWFNANRRTPALADIVAGYSHLSAGLVAKIDLPEAPMTIDPAQIGKTIDLMRQEGLLKAPMDPMKIVYTPATRP
ncbi:MAG TPA: ABC transporter substrate-binding protein [Alphaproteobacteria bacterium]|nr:ABC transporter substrate-binding protein [Alphaproteobacteria bacterium]